MPVNLNGDRHKKSIYEKLKIVKCIVIHKVSNYIKYPDHLSLMSPYYLGGLAAPLLATKLFWPDLISNMIARLG